MTQTQAQILPAEISSADAHKSMQESSLIVVDVRTEMEWMRTGIATGAHAISTQNRNFMEELKTVTNGDMNAPLGIICATGNRSAMVQRYLKDFGYSNVTNIKDGMMGNFSAPGWIRNNLPITSYTA